MAAADTEIEPLKRLGGGRWQTRDGRFTIEPGGGRWSLVDAEQTDELGLPRVRGPFPSLTAAKEAIADVRGEPADASPLAERIEEAPRRPATTERRRESARERDEARATPHRAGERAREEPEGARDPAWIARLGEPSNVAARQLLRDLERAGFDDAERIAREEIVEDRPAVARALLLRRLAEVVRDAGDDAAPLDVAGRVIEMITHGSDADAPARLPGWVLTERRDGAENRPLNLRRGELRKALPAGDDEE